MKAQDIQAITCLKATRAAQLFSWLEALPDASTWAFRRQPRCWGNLSPSFSREFPADAPRRIVADIERKITQEFRARYSKVYVDASGLPDPLNVASGSELLCLSVMQHYGVRETSKGSAATCAGRWTATGPCCSDGSGAVLARVAGRAAILWRPTRRPAGHHRPMM